MTEESLASDNNFKLGTKYKKINRSWYCGPEG